MNSHGIYTLANDVVYDQVIALINSIEVNIGPDIPICIIPYDERLTLIKQEIATRDNVSIYDNQDSIQRWENFAREVWAAHPLVAQQKRLAALSAVRVRAQRRYAAFDGPFDKFVVYDADCLAMHPLDRVFEKLDTYDFVFDDWEHKKPTEVAALDFNAVEKSGILTREELRPKLHCSSFWGSKRGFFNPEELASIQNRLINQKEVTWLRGISEAFLFSYMTLWGDRSLFNFTLSPNSQDRTGNCADADKFIEKDKVLYNQEGLKPIHRIHYMNYPSIDFTRLCQGEDVNLDHQELFLYYRFLKQPDQKPSELKPPSLGVKTNRFIQKTITKIKKKLVK
ncbi:MAG: Npun_R2821/Npun_R2822 family protein [Planktothrix sp.]